MKPALMLCVNLLKLHINHSGQIKRSALRYSGKEVGGLDLSTGILDIVVIAL